MYEDDFNLEIGANDVEIAEPQEEIIETTENIEDASLEGSGTDQPEQNEEETPSENIEPQQQTKEDNSKYAAARREAERELKELKARQDSFAKSYGYDNFEEFEVAQRQQKYIDEGYSTEIAQRLTQMDTMYEKMQKQEAMLKITQQKAELQNRKYFKELEPDIDALLESNPTLPVEVVFNFIKGQKMDELLSKETKVAAQRQLNNLNNKSHIKGDTGSANIDTTHVDEDEFKFYQRLNPSAKKEDYIKFIKSQRS